MPIQTLLFCIVCAIVYSYEEIRKNKWLSTVFFGLAIPLAQYAHNDLWIKTAPLLFSFSASRMISYSLPLAKKWPFNLALTSMIFYLLITAWKIPLPATQWTFELDTFFWAFLVGACFFSTLGLLIYFKFRDFELILIPIPPIQKKYVGVLIIVGSIINSFREEIPYRWLLLLPLATLTDPLTALIIQAIVFGAMHFHEGFTNKWLGFTMTALFGLAMGFATLHTGSIALAVTVHALVDMILLLIVVKKYVPDSYFKAG